MRRLPYRTKNNEAALRSLTLGKVCHSDFHIATHRPVLRVFARAGWARPLPVKRSPALDGKPPLPPRRYYVITEEGREQARRWGLLRDGVATCCEGEIVGIEGEHSVDCRVAS